MTTEFSESARKEWEAILPRYPTRRAALLPTLHLAVREFGAVTVEVEEYVARLLDLPLSAVHEVLTFYTLLPRSRQGSHHLRVCHGLPCALRGCEKVIRSIEERLGVPPGETTADGKWSWERASCLGSCEVAPMMQVDDDYVGPVDPDEVDGLLDEIEKGKTTQALPVVRQVPRKIVSVSFGKEDARRIENYRAGGGYRALERALIEMQPVDVREVVRASKLRGLGGAGFPTGVKWGFVPRESEKPVYLVVNADEGEPGTFKDRYIMEWDPHLLLEGMAIAAYAIGAHASYIYIRRGYTRAAGRLHEAIEEAREAGLMGEDILGTGFDLEPVIHMGAGGYICGEETALIESLEGKKGWPRRKPPFPAVVGAFGCPTIVNNVETLSYIPEIVNHGPDRFFALATRTERSGGLRTFSLSGHVERPGPYELPIGTTIRELIFRHGGGIPGDRRLKAVIPGGTSAPILTAGEIDKVEWAGGSGAVIVLAEGTCMVEATHILARFFSRESCGQCTPCREGSGWLERILARILRGGGVEADIENLIRITHNMCGTAICPLAEGAALPVRSIARKFRKEFEHHIRHGRCDIEPEAALAGRER